MGYNLALWVARSQHAVLIRQVRSKDVRALRAVFPLLSCPTALLLHNQHVPARTGFAMVIPVLVTLPGCDNTPPVHPVWTVSLQEHQLQGQLSLLANSSYSHGFYKENTFCSS